MSTQRNWHENWTATCLRRCVDSIRQYLLWSVNGIDNGKFYSTVLCLQLDDFSLVQFVPLDITNEDSVALLMQRVDFATQFGEDEEVQVPHDVDLDASDFGALPAGADARFLS